MGFLHMDVYIKKKNYTALELFNLVREATQSTKTCLLKLKLFFFHKGRFYQLHFFTESQALHTLTTADHKLGRCTLPSNKGQIFLQHMIPPRLVYWPSAVSSTNNGMPQVTRKRM